ncbi:hypothetical protein M3Y94_00769000 [Aphelenchoides besseyi]|nr:hypothetical protein M3Y94_00769000 [Aphelenchoides besseyi]KAI6232246.1 hypothetical protein M3Y95_00466200 [Aphelenchoides besseyi]
MPPKAGGNLKGTKRRPGRSENDKTQEAVEQPKQPVVAKCATNARAEVEKWAHRALEKGVEGLREEFLDLKRYVPPDMTVTAFVANHDAGRNRYKDVPCGDRRRVVVKWPGVAYDYIHANYVATPISDKRFILAQGPVDGTVVDFWHMIALEESDSIIMLCNIVEKGMNKCASYWPSESGQKCVYGDVEVTNNNVRQLTPEEMTVRISILTLRCKIDGKETVREVRHYHWVDWPDRGVPPPRLTALVLLSHVRGSKKPIVVHCSAGIGRTGTIVAIEFILERLQQGIPCEAMDELLKELRNQRPYAIQTDLQYLFVHRVMLFYFFEKYKIVVNTPENTKLYQQFVIDYDKATAV